MTTVINGIDELKARVGQHIGWSEWHEVTQEQIDAFAKATGDRQWIHVDPERAKQGPFGTTIAHGYLTLSLVPTLITQVMVVEGIKMSINYGANRIRFPAPVPSGAKIRLGATITDVQEIQGGVQNLIDVTIEVIGANKPSLAAQLVYRYYL